MFIVVYKVQSLLIYTLAIETMKCQIRKKRN